MYFIFKINFCPNTSRAESDQMGEILKATFITFIYVNEHVFGMHLCTYKEKSYRNIKHSHLNHKHESW